MKKFSRIASALFLSLQALITVAPVNVLADEKPQEQKTEQVQANDQAEKATTESSSDPTSESSTQPTESSTKPSGDSSSSSSSSTKPTETTTPSSEEQPKKPDPKPEEPKEEPQAQQESTQTPTEPVRQPAAPEQATPQQTPQTEPVAGIQVSESAQDGAISFEKDETVESFIEKLGEPARKIGKEKDLYASVMLAQAVLESASGSSSLAKAPNYNLFGIKGTHNGKSVSMATQEDLGNGTMYTTQSGFRVYENYEDCFNDYALLLTEGVLLQSFK